MAENGVHHGYSQVSLVEAGAFRPLSDAWRFVLDEFAPVHDAWLSWIDPGGFILEHVDAGPYRERWQVPIQPSGWLAHEGHAKEAAPGLPFLVQHWRPHSVRNDGVRPRIHLVIDRAVVLDPTPSPFAITQGAAHGNR